MARSKPRGPLVAMSQSIMAFGCSVTGLTSRLSGFRSMCSSTGAPISAGTSVASAAIRAATPSGRPSGHTASARAVQPFSWRAWKPSGLPRSPRPIAPGSSACRLAMACSVVSTSARPSPAWGGRVPAMATPSRRSISWNLVPSTASSAQKAIRRGANGNCGASAASTRASRAMSLAPAASAPGGGRRSTAGPVASSTPSLRLAMPPPSRSSRAPGASARPWPVSQAARRSRPVMRGAP